MCFKCIPNPTTSPYFHFHHLGPSHYHLDYNSSLLTGLSASALNIPSSPLLNLFSGGQLKSNHIIPLFKIPSSFSSHSEKKNPNSYRGYGASRIGSLISSRSHDSISYSSPLALSTLGKWASSSIPQGFHLRQFIPSVPLHKLLFSQVFARLNS